MIRVIAIGGEPATGKSTLVKALYARWDALGGAHGISFKACSGVVFPVARRIILGVYEPTHRFPGTDRLSMAVQPNALALLRGLNEDPAFQGYRVVFEGDRLFNAKFLEDLREAQVPVEVLVLEAPEEELARRHRARGDTQKAAFLKGRRTKIQNILSGEPEARRLQNGTPEEGAAALELVAAC